ncbi:MAG TPA: TonB family protein, partial [Aggregicoccus sp.]|nr:TonB family protein [Aggregicoccus sp.]
RPPVRKGPPPSAVALRSMSRAEWERNRRAQDFEPGPQQQATRPLPRAPEPRPKPAESEYDRDLSSARTAPGNNQEPESEKARNAETTNRVAKETQAREKDSFAPNIASKTTAPTEQPVAGGAPGQRAAGNSGTGDEQRAPATRRGQAELELPSASKRDELALKTEPGQRGPGVGVSNRRESEAMAGNSRRLRTQQGTGGQDDEASQGQASSGGLAALMPSAAAMGRIVGAAPQDVYQDVDEGEETLLNTRSWKHAGFFNRMYRRVEEEWRVLRELRRRDASLEIYGGQKYTTVVGVTLDEDGRVADVALLSSSGLTFLDQEAIRAFTRNGTFPNFPKELVKENGVLKLRFGFIVDLTGVTRRDSLRYWE